MSALFIAHTHTHTFPASALKALQCLQQYIHWLVHHYYTCYCRLSDIATVLYQCNLGAKLALNTTVPKTVHIMSRDLISSELITLWLVAVLANWVVRLSPPWLRPGEMRWVMWRGDKTTTKDDGCLLLVCVCQMASHSPRQPATT